MTPHVEPTRSSFALALLLAGSAACVVGRDYHPPEPALAPEWSEPVPAGPAAGDDWWNAFGDPELSVLVDRALRSSPDLRAAVARVRAARAERGIVAAALYPTVDATASYSNSRLSENGFLKGLDPGGSLPGAIAPGQQIDLEQIGLEASWELDLFGLHRRAVEEAEAQAELELYGLDDALVSLAAEVADGYVELCGLRHRLDLARANEASLRESLDVVRERSQAGLTGEVELARAETALAGARARVPELEAAARVAEHRLETLVGVQPGELAAELAGSRPVPAAPDALAAGIPSELLRRRPDVRMAERALAAATAASSAARADLLPHFSLTGTFGLQSQSLSDLASWDSRFWVVGPAVRWPLLDFGRRKSVIAERDARVDEAQAAYDSRVLAALADVENALARLARADARNSALADAERSSARAAALTDELYRNGLGEYEARLETNREHRVAEDAQVLGRVDQARDAIALFRALGGGWETAREQLSASLPPGSR